MTETLRLRLEQITRLADDDLLQSAARVTQSAVMPVLNCLGWDTYHPEEVSPDEAAGIVTVFSTSGGRRQAVLSIRAVKHGDPLDGAFGRDTSAATVSVVTDGTQYLLRHHLDEAEVPAVLIHADSDNAANRLQQFLDKPSVISGESQTLLAAEQKHLVSLRVSWLQMLSNPDAELVALLSKRSAGSGPPPNIDAVREFLSEQGDLFSLKFTHNPKAEPSKLKKRKQSVRYSAFELLGETHTPPDGSASMNGKVLMQEVLERIHALDPTVLEKMRRDPENVSPNNKSQFVGLSEKEFAPHVDHKLSFIQVDRYFINTHLNHKSKMKRLEQIANHAAIGWDTDLRVFTVNQ